jgi:phenylacetate-CoA ligase
MIWNPEAETQAPPARARLQSDRLRDVVAWAVERVPFHRERLGGLRVRGLADLTALPFTRKTDLREHYPFGLFAVPTGELARIHASSGTKGKPTVVGYTVGDLAVWCEAMARVMVAAGPAGEMLTSAFGYGLFTGGLGFTTAPSASALTVVPVSSATPRAMFCSCKIPAAGICGTPSFVLHIAESLAEQGATRARWVCATACSGEPWTEGLRTASTRLRPAGLRHLWAQRDRRARGGRRVRAASGPARLRRSSCPRSSIPPPVRRGAPGQEGELVLTTLTKRAVPMVRYRTGDVTTLSTEPCACGRTSARIAHQGPRGRHAHHQGRQPLSLRGGSDAAGRGGAAAHYLLVVDRSATLARLEVQVEPGRRCWSVAAGSVPSIRRWASSIAA